MRKLLRSRFFRVLFIILLAVALFLFQDYIESQISGIEARTNVYVVNKDLQSKHMITEDDVHMIDILITEIPSYSTKDKNDVIGKYLIEPLTKGDFVLTSNLSEIQNFESLSIPLGYKMISIPLEIDNAAGWKIEKNQIVEVVYSPYQYKNIEGSENVVKESTVLYSTKIIKNVTVVDIFNEALVSIDHNSFTGIPKYVVLLLEDGDAEFVALAKDKGRFDILMIAQEN